VFQAYTLLPVLSAVENAELVLQVQGVAAAERRRRATEALARVGLAGLEHRRPAEMSGGQQQRVAVARAIVCRPALVLADEPTANLDSSTATSLIALMSELNATDGVTFMFATHDPRVLEAARRVVRLVDGRVDEDARR
jgi:putative ABC transport system ATP-binding protein